MKSKILILLLFISTLVFSQEHIEILTSVSDSMLLMQKSEIDVINKVFYQRDLYRNLTFMNDSIINQLQKIINYKNIVIEYKDSVIVNENLKFDNLLQNSIEKDNKIIDMKASMQKSEKEITLWKTISGTSILTIILILIL